MIKFDVMNRWTGAVQFTAEIDCDESATASVKLGLAVKWGVEMHANLSGADLSRAYLSGADLSRANLSRADLSRANLSDANLSRADLSGADLSRAYLSGADLSRANLSDANLSRADLSGADLSRAYLSRADLSGADLSRAYLSRANLSRADLSRANLSRADLSRAYWADGVTVSQPPIQISGLYWPVTILDQHMQIGCELHSLADWDAFDNERIAQMDGATARRFWRDHKEGLLTLARGAGRSFEPLTQKDQKEEKE